MAVESIQMPVPLDAEWNLVTIVLADAVATTLFHQQAHWVLKR